MSEQVCKDSMKKAIEEAVEPNSEESKPRDLTISLDTWQKQGHMSLNGILSASSLTTSKIVYILSKYCTCKKKLNDTRPIHK